LIQKRLEKKNDGEACLKGERRRKVAVWRVAATTNVSAESLLMLLLRRMRKTKTWCDDDLGFAKRGVMILGR
jgi:hypothetical protein